jgi:hypothetical protein
VIHVVYLREAQDFNAPADAPDFPQEWYNALCWYLTLAIAPMFDVDWTVGLQTAFAAGVAAAREQSPSRSSAFFQAEDEDNN